MLRESWLRDRSGLLLLVASAEVGGDGIEEINEVRKARLLGRDMLREHAESPVSIIHAEEMYGVLYGTGLPSRSSSSNVAHGPFVAMHARTGIRRGDHVPNFQSVNAIAIKVGTVGLSI